ncbi:MAG: thioredoxin-dependent thiol peroxidase [Muribaculaceae bacterium]|nr:thioredoxin-dependent thiol peroxidase [Muribaculaceae bacterium]
MNIGDKLPEVLGKDQNGNEIRTVDFAGKKFILYTYPKDNTSGCTAEACSLRDHRDELLNLGYEVVGVSKDSAASHQKFIEKHQLNFPLIADTDTTLLQQLGAWGEKTMCGRKSIGTLRTTYLIDEEGRIADIFLPKQIKTKEHAQQIIDRVK